MKFKFGKENHALKVPSAGKFSGYLTGTVNVAKDAKLAIITSSQTSISPTQDESFRIQAELRRNNGLLYQTMIPPR